MRLDALLREAREYVRRGNQPGHSDGTYPLCATFRLTVRQEQMIATNGSVDSGDEADRPYAPLCPACRTRARRVGPG